MMDYTNIAIIIAITTGLTEMIKRAVFPEDNHKWTPILAVLIGTLASVFLFPADTVRDGILIGIIAGLSSVGLYSTSKNTIQAIEK